MANIKISELNSLTEKDYTDVLPIVDTSANETKKISVEELANNNVSLIAVSSTAPSEATQGDEYYNTETNKIYTYVGGGEWADKGTPKNGIFYIVFDKQSTYAYDGETLVSVGGGSGGETLPVGSEIDFDGQASDIPAGWEQVSGKSYVAYDLYSNDSGSNSNITLNDSATNYEYIEIFYRNVDNNYMSVKVYSPNNKNALLSSQAVITNSLLSVHSRTVKISGTTINTVNYECLTLWSGQTITLESNNLIYITKVVGYKEV